MVTVSKKMTGFGSKMPATRRGSLPRGVASSVRVSPTERCSSPAQSWSTSTVPSVKSSSEPCTSRMPRNDASVGSIPAMPKKSPSRSAWPQRWRTTRSTPSTLAISSAMLGENGSPNTLLTT